MTWHARSRREANQTVELTRVFFKASSLKNSWSKSEMNTEMKESSSTYFLSVCVATGESAAGGCSDTLGGSDRESFSRDTGLSSLQETHTHTHCWSFLCSCSTVCTGKVLSLFWCWPLTSLQRQQDALCSILGSWRRFYGLLLQSLWKCVAEWIITDVPFHVEEALNEVKNNHLSGKNPKYKGLTLWSSFQEPKKLKSL